MQKVFKIINVIVAILPYLIQIVDLFKKNKEAFEDLGKKVDEEDPVVVEPEKKK